MAHSGRRYDCSSSRTPRWRSRLSAPAGTGTRAGSRGPEKRLR
eukprot:CAMPEP_0175441312 /NCGR_PEP_ID=MMETSP0095-20121207/57528_1 /TAXON_ID=311494 /ORGANISM="Alexandrium monilatum, Strain CCMP3105" /LENGTH=42 /DNA_ID= /DNA_START= /DNA_END= /DNA_ORIENTATION=